ncbi:DUF4440 domain-containing protein [Caulobacter sp. X]|nr:DUF4440 domain-containing protein [Caulobacter sp. X]PIC02282.1 DUF4440 domain-containing protein [Caulobacter sp. X]
MILGLLFVALAGAAQGAEPTGERKAVEAVIADSAKGWNAGDVGRFMASYSDAPQTSFVTAEGLVRGKAAMLERYRTKYDFGDPAKRGVLTFETLDFRPLDKRHALYVARWTLTYADGKAASGYTTLVMAHEKAGWRIIADHSS